MKVESEKERMESENGEEGGERGVDADNCFIGDEGNVDNGGMAGWKLGRWMTRGTV